MKSADSVSALAFIVILVVGLGAAFGLRVSSPGWPTCLGVAGVVSLAFVLSSSIRDAHQWDKAVALRVRR